MGGMVAAAIAIGILIVVFLVIFVLILLVDVFIINPLEAVSYTHLTLPTNSLV